MSETYSTSDFGETMDEPPFNLEIGELYTWACLLVQVSSLVISHSCYFYYYRKNWFVV